MSSELVFDAFVKLIGDAVANIDKERKEDLIVYINCLGWWWQDHVTLSQDQVDQLLKGIKRNAQV